MGIVSLCLPGASPKSEVRASFGKAHWTPVCKFTLCSELRVEKWVKVRVPVPLGASSSQGNKIFVFIFIHIFSQKHFRPEVRCGFQPFVTRIRCKHCEMSRVDMKLAESPELRDSKPGFSAAASQPQSIGQQCQFHPVFLCFCLRCQPSWASERWGPTGSEGPFHHV